MVVYKKVDDKDIYHGVDEFLRFFDGDVEEATIALNNYSTNNTRKGDDKRTIPANTHVLLSIHDIEKRYKVGAKYTEVLRGIGLDIYEGEIVALVGASGSGKSTLLHILGCVDRPTSGEVKLEGEDITKLHDRALSELRKSKIGFVFQSFYLQPFLNLHDNIAVPAMFTSAKKKEIDSKVSELLKSVGMADRAEHYPKELSGGQIQRAAIARALINNPAIIIADEPTGNLDSRNSRTVIELFKSVREQFGTTIIIATHDQSIATEADRVIEIRDGTII